MLEHISTAALAVFFLSAFSIVPSNAVTSQADVDYIAANLDIKVIVGTSHMVASGSYDVSFELKNTGQRPILDDNDWKIQFSMKDKNNFEQDVFEVHGFQIRPLEGCLYIMNPNPSAATLFPGLKPQQTFRITIKAKGLSIFKTDFYPRFVIYTDTTTPKNIASTNDEDLGFVMLAPGNDSFSDFSRMSGIRRSMTQPDTTDIGRVPPTIIIPAPKAITPPTERLVDLSTVSLWYVWADGSVSQQFKDLFLEKMGTVPNVTKSMFSFVNSQPRNGSNVIYMQIANDASKTTDSYTLAIRPGPRGQANVIHMSATSTIGLNNALESLMAILGLFNVMPEITIDDDARFGVRSINLDVTKNFVPVPVVKKFISLMKMYKLNNLVLTLASDYGWRIQLPSRYDFPELVTLASKRCIDQSRCLPPAFGSGADENTSGSGFYTVAEFGEILRHARDRYIRVVPKINVFGSLRSAKFAGKARYERLKSTDLQSAELYNLNTPLPSIPGYLDGCYTDGVMDPCSDKTYSFIELIIKALTEVYAANSVSFGVFHAGGDATSKYFGEFPSCKAAGVSQASAMQRMVMRTLGAISSFGQNTQLWVSEEAVVDPATGTCLTASGQYNPSAITVDFWNMMPGLHTAWNLNPTQWDFINAPVPTPAMMNTTTPPTPDPLKPYNGPRKGLAPWGVPYDCANKGYKVILSPENFFSMDSPYELDFDEPGNRHKDRFHVISLHRMLMFEPFNLHINQDLGNDRYSYLPYRLCKVFQCNTLTRPENVLGLQATVDSSIIRTEDRLWEMVLPRLMLFAEKAWREGPFENIVKAEDVQTIVNATNMERRAFFLNLEMTNFINNFGYKESGRLDHENYHYRIARPAASIYFALPFRVKPPYPVVVKVAMAGADIQMRDLTSPNPQWRAMFERNEMTGMMSGGYNFTFPESNQRIEIRTMSTDGTRGSIPTLLIASSYNLFPREIPIEFREGTCLPIAEAWTTQLEDITLPQWRRLVSNIDSVIADEQSFIQQRERTLGQRLATFNRRLRSNFTLPEVFYNINAFMSQGRNLSLLPDNNVYRHIFEADMQLSETRGNTINQRYDTWEQQYQACSSGSQSQTAPAGRPGQSRGPPAGRPVGRPGDRPAGRASPTGRGVRPGQGRRGASQGRLPQAGR